MERRNTVSFELLVYIVNSCSADVTIVDLPRAIPVPIAGCRKRGAKGVIPSWLKIDKIDCYMYWCQMEAADWLHTDTTFIHQNIWGGIIEVLNWDWDAKWSFCGACLALNILFFWGFVLMLFVGFSLSFSNSPRFFVSAATSLVQSVLESGIEVGSSNQWVCQSCWLLNFPAPTSPDMLTELDLCFPHHLSLNLILETPTMIIEIYWGAKWRWRLSCIVHFVLLKICANAFCWLLTILFRSTN